jgi:hypothetical protein
MMFATMCVQNYLPRRLWRKLRWLPGDGCWKDIDEFGDQETEGRLERLTEDRPEVRLLHRDDQESDYWTLSLGCAIVEVASRLEAGWN